MAKKISGYVKLMVPAGGARGFKGLGPALGQRGVSIPEFTKTFEAKTQNVEKNAPVPVVLTVYQDKSFSMVTKKPPMSYLIKKAAGISKGASNPGKETVASISRVKLNEIAEYKIEDLNCYNIEGAIKMAEGTANSLGIKVE